MNIRQTAKRLYDAVMQTYKIDDAYELWRDYREQTTAFVLKQTFTETNWCKNSAAVLGAGSCNDLDLLKLSHHFSSITLLDVDAYAMEQALLRYDLAAFGCPIFLQPMDFLGITEETYLEFCELEIANTYAGNRIETILTDYMNTVYASVEDYNWTKELEKMFDVVISLGVHSQLNALFPRLWVEWSHLMQLPNTHQVEGRALLENQKIIPRYNNQILSLTRNQWIVGCEKSRLGMAGGIAGASEAIWDIESKVQKRQLQQVDDQDFTWKLTATKAYDMRLYALQKC